MLSTKELVFKEKPVKKLTERYIRPYKIEEVVSRNAVKLKLPASIRIHLVVNISKIEKYKKQVREQRVKELKLVEVDGVEEQKVEKILNKRKLQGVDKYLVRQKVFIAENNIQEREKDLENTKELVNEFKERLDIEIRQQERIDKIYISIVILPSQQLIYKATFLATHTCGGDATI